MKIAKIYKNKKLMKKNKYHNLKINLQQNNILN
jgi:hypothetical protein